MYKEIREKLIKMSDKDVAKFTARVCSDVNIEDILGIKIPELRKLAKEIIANNDFKLFLDLLG